VATTGKTQSKLPYILQILFALAGLGLSVYLLVQHTRLKNGIQGDSFCSFGPWADCAAVNASRYSEIAGMPLATLDYLFFASLLMLALVARPGKRGFVRVQRWAAWLVALGLLVDVGLLVVQVAFVHSLCLVCNSAHLMALGFFICTVILAGGQEAGIGDKVKAALCRRGKENSPVSGSAMAFATFGWLGLALAVTMIPGTVVSKTTEVTSQANQIAEYWNALPRTELPIKSGDGTLGTPAAKVRIVEFSDFQCPFCQRAASTLHQALEPMKDRVYFAFKNFPLDNKCNPKLDHPMHANACNLAQLAFCAKEKGKFWEYHDTVFGFEEKLLEGSIDALQAKLAKIFPAGDFKACLESTSARQNVREDIELGIKLDVRATPSLYINGKKMVLPITEENVRLLVEMEEKALAGK